MDLNSLYELLALPRLMSVQGVVNWKPSYCPSVPNRWLITSINALTGAGFSFVPGFTVELDGVGLADVEVVGLALHFLGVAEGDEQDWGIHDSADLARQKHLREIDEGVES